MGVAKPPAGKSEAGWESSLARFQAFQATHGRMPRKLGDSSETSLYVWLNAQRAKLRRGTLRPQAQALLVEAGLLEVVPADAACHKASNFSIRFAELKVHLEQHGTLDNLGALNESLLRWLGTRRDAMNAGTIDAGEEQALRELGIEARQSRRTRSWEEMFEEFRLAASIHGTADYLLRRHAHPMVLMWVVEQRQQADIMSMERRAMLDNAGFLWLSRRQLPRGTARPDSTALLVWRTRVRQAQLFLAANAHLNVPVHKEPALARWLDDLVHNLDQLPPQRVEELGTAGLIKPLEALQATMVRQANPAGEPVTDMNPVLDMDPVPDMNPVGSRRNPAQDAGVLDEVEGGEVERGRARAGSQSVLGTILSYYGTRYADADTVAAFVSGLSSLQSQRRTLWVSEGGYTTHRGPGRLDTCNPAELSQRLTTSTPSQGCPDYLVLDSLGNAAMATVLRCLQSRMDAKAKHADMSVQGKPSIILSGGPAHKALCMRLGILDAGTSPEHRQQGEQAEQAESPPIRF